ncbi:unnamed protein product [Caenorhabditis auriculariae]|uniref:Uncharacterized protein n=1 Tax=Caenorhabditis auriculariae TaxID=2777116 RepID=A0A8S1HCH8_9PELO|nr:unnamed protein product [Caenorhabditis auriculariae]
MTTAVGQAANKALLGSNRPILRRIKGLLSRGKPVALIFGYGSCPRKINEKYTEVYRKHDLPGVSITSEFFDETIPPPRVLTNIAPIMRKMTEEELRDLPPEYATLHERKIIIHANSMNGAKAVGAFYNYAMKNNINIKDRVLGLTFDSTPSTLPMLWNVWGQLLTVKKDICDIPRPLRYPFLFPRGFYHCTLREFYRKFMPEKLKHHNLFDFLNEVCPLPKNQLFIYSLDDEVVRYECIEKFIEYQRKVGNDVETLMFPQSPHVRHLEAKRKKYEKTMAKFVKKCLAAA